MREGEEEREGEGEGEGGQGEEGGREEGEREDKVVIKYVEEELATCMVTLTDSDVCESIQCLILL